MRRFCIFLCALISLEINAASVFLPHDEDRKLFTCWTDYTGILKDGKFSRTEDSSFFITIPNNRSNIAYFTGSFPHETLEITKSYPWLNVFYFSSDLSINAGLYGDRFRYSLITNGNSTTTPAEITEVGVMTANCWDMNKPCNQSWCEKHLISE